MGDVERDDQLEGPSDDQGQEGVPTAAVDDFTGEAAADAGGNGMPDEALSDEGPAGEGPAGEGHADEPPALDEAPADDAVGAATPLATDAAEPSSDAPDVVFRSAELKSIVEALIFASPEPLSLKAICKLLDAEPREDVEAALTALKADYERPGGLQLVDVAGGCQIVTRPDLHEWVRRLFHERSTSKLSVQALETLAVIAYRQPVTAAEITDIRGVNTSGVLNTLLERHLVKIVGRKEVVGRPFMYATTREFLIRFGLNDIADLPKVQDMVDAFGLESPLLIERTPAEDQLPLDEPDAEPAAGGAAAARPDDDPAA